jgi:hypothetical protein
MTIEQLLDNGKHFSLKGSGSGVIAISTLEQPVRDNDNEEDNSIRFSFW